MKPREFWITLNGFTNNNRVSDLPEKPVFKDDWVYHVREVVPIDLDKVWQTHVLCTLNQYGLAVLGKYDRELIENIVEKQLKGEE